MSNVWFCSDLHLGHKNIGKFRAPLVNSTEENNSRIIADLKKTDIIIPIKCPYLNIILTHHQSRGQSRQSTASLDRIEPSRGYVKGNIEVISHLANTMKNNATPELLQNFANEILRRYPLR